MLLLKLVPVLLFFLLHHPRIVSGGVVFPLRSVDVSVVECDKDLVIVELQLVRDVAEYLEPLPPETFPKFFIESVLPLLDAFFIQNNLLILRGSSNNSPVENNYKITIGGRLGHEGPAYMTVNVTFSDAADFCDTHARDACFWPGSFYQMPENIEPPEASLLAIASPFLASFCPHLLVTYNLPCKSSAKCTGAIIERKDNEHGSWQLSLQNGLDREYSATEDVVVTCEVIGPNISHSYQETITLEIVDVDDERPQLHINSLGVTTSLLRKGDEVANGNVSDKDLQATNNLEFSLDVDWLTITCNPLPYIDRTLLYCSVICTKDMNLTDDLPFTITVKDSTLLTGFGPKTSRKNFVLLAPKPQSLAVVQRPVIKYAEVVSVTEGAVKWTRVAAPENVHGFRGAFTTMSPYFAVTPKEGIIYVNNSKKLIYNRDIKITIKWDGGEEVITVNITKAVPGKCASNSREKYTNVYCAKASNESECNSICGIGLIPNPGSDGGCHWVETKSLAQIGSWWSCSPSPATCPNTVCDELEQLQPALCPQDCAKQSVGTGATKKSKGGINDANGICHCNVETDRCECSIFRAQQPHVFINTYNTTQLTVEPTESDGIRCGWSCQLSAVGSFLGLTVGAVIVLLYVQRLRAQTKRSSCTEPETGKADVIGFGENVRPLRTSLHEEPTSSSPSVPSRPLYYDEKWEFPRHRLTIYETVGEGEFGKVVKAMADGIRGQKGALTVAVKTVRGGCAEEDLVSELELLKEVDHPNVIKLLGACTTLDGPLYLIIEFAHFGSLRSYLRKQRETVQAEGFQQVELTGYSQLLTFSWHIAKGMEYLSDMKLVHRDLAARNVLLTEELVCKISDFGLTRDIYEDDTYLKKSKGKVPIKWMAVECLSDDLYTIKSDVWSYGVLLWEIVTYGSTPYPGISAHNLFSLLQGGYRMEQPNGCSPNLYNIMRACWAAAPPDRPSFSAIVVQLDALLSDTSPHPYLQLAANAVDNPHYIHPWGPVAATATACYDQPREPACCEPSKCSHPRYVNELHKMLPNERAEPGPDKGKDHDTSQL